MWWLRQWALEPKHLRHLLAVQADDAHRTKALLALQAGRIVPNILGPRLNGTGDILCYEAPRPR
jgi:hypothetical protein